MLGTKYSGNKSSTAHTWDLSVNTLGKSHNKWLSQQSQQFPKLLIILPHLTWAKLFLVKLLRKTLAFSTLIASSETQGQSVSSGEKAGPKFSIRAEEPLGTDSHRTISKNSSGCRLLIGHKKSFVLLCPIGEQFLLSPFRKFVHDSYCLATVARFVHQACAYNGNFYFLLSQPETKELPMSRKKVWDAISRSNWICPEIFCFWRITMYCK